MTLSLSIAIFIALCIYGIRSEDSFWDSEFDKKPYDIFQYSGSYITIFKHASQSNIFYVPPPVLLDKKSGSIFFNSLKNTHEIRWNVILWTDDIDEAVRKHLKQRKKLTDSVNVRIIPMDKIRFAYTSIFVDMDSRYLLETNWIPNNHLPSVVNIVFYTRIKRDAERLLESVRQNAMVLDQVAMEYQLTSQKSATKKIIVKAEYIASAKLFAKLETINSPNPAERYLNATDMNNLIEQSYMTIKATVVREKEYIETPDEDNVMSLIKEFLTKDRVNTQQLREQIWQSAYWDPIYAKPDRIASMLNKVYEKEQRNHRILKMKESAKKKIENSETESSECLLFNCRKKASTSQNKIDMNKKFSIEELNDYMREKNIQVEYNGDIFLPKNMDLYRINIAEIKSGKTIATTSIQISKKSETYAIKMKTESEVATISKTAAYSSLVCSDNLYSYKGCYQDNFSDRDLSDYKEENTKTMTINLCYDTCANLGKKYFSLQRGYECYCSNNFGKYGLQYEKQCNSRCVGSQKDVCGGFLRNSVYEIHKYPESKKSKSEKEEDRSLSAKKIKSEEETIVTEVQKKKAPMEIQNKINEKYRYTGCYEDYRLALTNTLDADKIQVHNDGSNVGMTTDGCATVCRDFKYFGLQDYMRANTCLCWNEDNNMERKHDEECKNRCRGNRRDICGRRFRTASYSYMDKDSDTNNKTKKKSPYQFLGCFFYTWRNDRVEEPKTWSNKMTKDICYQFCYQKNSKYFYLQNKKECHCLNKRLANEDRECSTNCRNEFCDAPYLVSQYENVNH